MVALRDGVSRAQEFQVLRGLHRRDIQGIVEVRGEEGALVYWKFVGVKRAVIFGRKIMSFINSDLVLGFCSRVRVFHRPGVAGAVL